MAILKALGSMRGSVPLRGCALRAYCNVASRGRHGKTHNAEQHDAAADAEVSSAEFYSEVWPDGTPKRFRGREAWKNWIDFDSPYRAQSDDLNRQRHYFFHVDTRGRLWRKELHQPEEDFGQLRDPRLLDHFFGHMQHNFTGLHSDRFPFISLRAHEHYFTSCTVAPLVFNDLRDGELQHLCPDGELARSITTRFDPSELRITDDGKLLHPVVTRGVGAEDGRRITQRLMALIESSTAQQLLECCEEHSTGHGRPDEDGDMAIVLRWHGSETVLQPYEAADATRPQ